MNSIGLEMIEADSLDQVRGQCVYPMVSEEYREAFKALTQDVFMGRSGTLEFKMIGLKGQSLWLFTKAVPLRNEKGEIVLSLAITIDITKRKCMEDTLRESEERYRRIAEAITDYLYTVTVQNGIPVETKHNEACIAVTGYPSKEFADNPYLWIRMVPGEDHALVRKQAEEVLSGYSPNPIEHRIIRKDGDLRWVESSIVPHYDINGNLISYDGIVRDITERKRTEAEREKLINELKDALAKIKQLSGMLPICASCKKIKDDNGHWKQIESYIRDHAEVEFSHGMCPECSKKSYEELEKLKKKIK